MQPHTDHRSYLIPADSGAVHNARRSALASELIRRGLPTTVVQGLTRIKPPVLRDMWAETHGERPRPGMSPDSAYSFLRKGEVSAIEMQVALSVYAILQGKSSLLTLDDDPSTLLRTHDYMCAYTGRDFSIRAIWYGVRDARTDLWMMTKCSERSCGAVYLFHTDCTNHVRCPFHDPLKRSRARRGRGKKAEQAEHHHEPQVVTPVYDAEFKAGVVAIVLRGDVPIEAVAELKSVSVDLVMQWREEALAGLSNTFREKAGSAKQSTATHNA